eukprot:GHUV01033060.1.p1 GENE.GHUV01033060.1~~GHUV01033060.1.p1  ORF type:complete len:282 (+),score=86.32 GHUV01033060.1:1938-2783(+)
MDGLDDVFFDVGNEVMDDVINTYAANTAAPSGWTTPRHPGVCIPEAYASSGGPGSPAPNNPRGSADLHGASRLVQQSSLLQTVTEGLEGLGGDDFAAGPFASVGFSGPIGNMPRVGSSRFARPPSGPLDAMAFLSKQQQQNSYGGSAAGTSSPIRSWSPTPHTESLEDDNIVLRSSSNGSMEKMQRASSARRRSGVGVSIDRSRGSAVELTTPQAPNAYQDGRSSHRASDMGEDATATAALSSTGQHSTQGPPRRVLDRSNSSNNSREGLIGPGQYSSPWQ